MKEQLRSMKADLKNLAAKLKKEKQETGYSYFTYIEYRHRHIAYCLLHGTPFEKIESKHRDPKNGVHEYVKKKAEEIVKKIKEGGQYECRKEDIRVSGQAPVAQPASRTVWTRIGELCQFFW